VPVLREDAGVLDLVLRIPRAAAPRLLQDAGVRVPGLRVLVESLHVRMGRRRIEIEVRLLDVLAVVPLGSGQAGVTPIQDRIVPGPEGERKAQTARAVGDPEKTVLPPAIRPAAGVVVRKVVPAGPVLGVVLANGPPLALRQVGAPSLPVLLAPGVL